MARALATAILLLCGCTERARPAPALAPTATAAPALAPPAAPALELSAAPPAEPVQVSILSPEQGQVLAPGDAAATPIKVHSARADWLLELSLDGRRLRPTASLPEQPTLGDLSEGAALEAGRHYVVAALRPSEQAPARFAVSVFSVELGLSGGDVIVYCGGPSGTYYGASDPLLLEFTTFGPGLDADAPLLVRASRSNAAEPAREARLRDHAPRLVHGLAPGDWSIELELLGADDRPLSGRLARHRCELTLNEAPAP